MKDGEIIALFFERSERAITELGNKYGAAMKRVASNILRDTRDAEECLSEAYLQLWNAIPPLRPDSLSTYACRVARNVSLDRYHSNTAAKRNSFYDAALDELEESVPALGDVETELAARELAGYMNRFLATLSYDERYIFTRRYFYADSVKSIAAEMGLKPHTVTVRLSRIRERLQKYLKKEGMIA